MRLRLADGTAALFLVQRAKQTIPFLANAISQAHGTTGDSQPDGWN